MYLHVDSVHVQCTCNYQNKTNPQTLLITVDCHCLNKEGSITKI